MLEPGRQARVSRLWERVGREALDNDTPFDEELQEEVPPALEEFLTEEALEEDAVK